MRASVQWSVCTSMQTYCQYSLYFCTHQLMRKQLAKDNPFWPNSSAEDRAKDEAAGLCAPLVTEDGEWELSEHDVECLAIGAGILGCGGGGDPYGGRLRALRKLQTGKKIKIMNPCRYVCVLH